MIACPICDATFDPHADLEEQELNACSKCEAPSDPYATGEIMECPSCMDTLYMCPACREWSDIARDVKVYECPECEELSEVKTWEQVEDDA